MAFSDNKITDAQIASAGVQSQPNKLTGSAAQNKAVFDKLVTDVVKAALNGLIDALNGTGAAGELGVEAIAGLTATNVQAALEEIVTSMQSITQGSVSDGSITTGKLADGAVTAAKLASSIVPDDVGIKMGTTVPTTSDIGEGEIYLMYA